MDNLLYHNRSIHFCLFTHCRLSLSASYRDMAEIVDQQGIMVDEIVVTTEKSHERAQAGLDQVQKAAANQATCITS